VERKKDNIIQFTDAKGKQIKNLNVEPIDYFFAVAVLVLGIYTFGFKDRNQDAPKDSFTYITNEDESIQAQGSVSYNEIFNHWYLVEKELTNGTTELFVLKWDFWGNYYDVENGKQMDDTFLSREKFANYLVTYGMVKDYYDIDDINFVLEKIKEDHQSISQGSDKVLRKEEN